VQIIDFSHLDIITFLNVLYLIIFEIIDISEKYNFLYGRNFLENLKIFLFLLQDPCRRTRTSLVTTVTCMWASTCPASGTRRPRTARTRAGNPRKMGE
jgi:hypothetical protein